MKRIAVFGSGSGSNIENICSYFEKSNTINVVLVCTNNRKSLIVTRAKKFGVPIYYTTKKELSDFSQLQSSLKVLGVDYIILAGFLLKIPEKMVNYYKKRIINIHPSLLPKYGGKGMYGANVHRAVLKNNERESGITIHFVNKFYDQGEVILQKKCVVSKKETVNSLEKKIKSLESAFFPKTIEKTIINLCQ